jgi:NADH-quinone oxidoreductase subunit N
MTANDFLHLTPLIILATAPVIIMIVLTVSRNFRVISGFSMIMMAAALVSLFILPSLPHEIPPLLTIDPYGVMFLGIIITASLIVVILTSLYFRLHGGEKEEYMVIVFVAALGASILVTSVHFVSFFLGLETLSISLYILIAYIRYRDYSIEAGVKFLVVASVATAFLLFGMALIYASTGSMTFSGIALAIKSGGYSPILLAGIGMMLAGIGFKLALVPFHMWAPDIYQGAPAPVTGFIASVSKGAILAVALRFFSQINGNQNVTILTIITIIAILSMFVGNLLALKQKNIKRLLAYSSIAQMGYLIITLLTGTVTGIHAAVFFVISYLLTILGAFGVISLVSSHHCDAENIDDFKGLFQTNPWIAIVMSVTMFSLAGIPLTAGFIAKFYLVLEGVRSGLWLLAFSLVITTVISLFYYLRVIKTMFTPSDNIPFEPLPVAGSIVLGLITIGILLLGILPSFLNRFITNFII